MNPDATVLETLRRIQFDQMEISKHENIALGDLLSEGIPVSGLFQSLLNFRNHVGDQRPIGDNSTDSSLFDSLRPGSRDGYVPICSTAGLIIYLFFSYYSFEYPFVSTCFLQP
jgi:hypothetical protein